MSESTLVAPTERGSNVFGRVISALGPLLVFMALFAMLFAMAPAFRKPTSWALLMLEASAIGLVAAGQTFVILTGGIDLSVEAMVSFSGVLAAILISGSNVAGGQLALGMPAWAGMLIAVLAGGVIGLVQGLIITGLSINPFIVTLGFRSILLGVALVATRGAGINIGRGPFVEFITSNVNVGIVRLPMPLIIMVVVYFISWIILRQTKLGRYTYAIGGNETATRLSGINVDWYKMLIYGISSLFAALAGVIVMARLQSGAYQNGTNMTLISVAAVVIGGTALSGGVGGIWGTLVGVFILRIVEQGLVYMNVPSNAKEIVIGAIIVLAVALDVIRRGEVRWLRFNRRRSA